MTSTVSKTTDEDSRARGRQPNSLETVRITISTTPQIIEMLERLMQTGLFGKSPAEAAERLISESLIRKKREGELPVESQ